MNRVNTEQAFFPDGPAEVECTDCGGTLDQVGRSLAEELWRCRECDAERWIVTGGT